jgi:hypothetical protein
VAFRHVQHAVQAQLYGGGSAAGQHAGRGAGRKVRTQQRGSFNKSYRVQPRATDAAQVASKQVMLLYSRNPRSLAAFLLMSMGCLVTPSHARRVAGVPAGWCA